MCVFTHINSYKQQFFFWKCNTNTIKAILCRAEEKLFLFFCARKFFIFAPKCMFSSAFNHFLIFLLPKCMEDSICRYTWSFKTVFINRTNILNLENTLFLQREYTSKECPFAKKAEIESSVHAHKSSEITKLTRWKSSGWAQENREFSTLSSRGILHSFFHLHKTH